MRSVASRLKRIEACIPRRPVPRPRSEVDLQCWDATASLLRTMDPDHASLLSREFKAWAAARQQRAHFEISSLLYAAVRIVKRHLEKKTPLSLPAEVAAVYIAKPSLNSWHECEDCGYELPVGRPQLSANPPQPQIVYFRRSPLCGGEVSWCGFMIKQSREKSEAGGCIAMN